MGVFHFKRFSVEQRQTPAKITTDATVFASALTFVNEPKRVLEIGTGTGVLSLILAQRHQSITIKALEINPKALKEANSNFLQSPWSSRLSAIDADFRMFESEEKFDVIFSNPPFFINNLQSDSNSGKNLAYHTNSLSFEELSKGVDLNLVQKGEFHVMLPLYEMSLLESELGKVGLKCIKRVELKHQPKSKTIRVFNVFVRSVEDFNYTISELYVRDENDNFHPSYINLMKDFLTIF